MKHPRKRNRSIAPFILASLRRKSGKNSEAESRFRSMMTGTSGKDVEAAWIELLKVEEKEEAKAA